MSSKIVFTLLMAAITMDVVLADADEPPIRRNISELSAKFHRIKRSAAECGAFLAALDHWAGEADDAKEAGCKELKDPATAVADGECELTAQQGVELDNAIEKCAEDKALLEEIKKHAKTEGGGGVTGDPGANVDTDIPTGGQLGANDDDNSVPGIMTSSNEILICAISGLVVIIALIQHA